NPGDYVAHVDHGIGKFTGLTRLSTNGVEQEYLVLQYAAGDRLYVPADQIGRVSRYIGASDRAPTLNRLGTQEWQRTRRKVEESVARIAQELLRLHAARELAPGFAFSANTLWQQELEASFPYVETPDQVEAMTAVRDDMEKPRPMDRLICGDVGYGKTEVALRAAFKAVMDNKQVAILVPTTVLAQQHFGTFGERLQAFPLKLGMLSRFCSEEEELETLEGLANGSVDICIGTHRLLQKDICFKDLGLVIIDEEQHFGVVQKERLKQMRHEVNVLTLSATPIPRTLHMSLTGMRDMSIMETPPEERLSIKTYVGTYDDSLVRRAVLRELERNCQVFFVHNRVQSIATVASSLQALIPEARIAIAHGQMPEDRLEKVMADFISGDYDVLVTTTIIQLGLDMPNVNTLIVDQADRFGLSQLYQLRGRVGRGAHQAYAYFLFDKGKQLSPQANRRLRTIFEATELGAGLGVAMKDLEIRGAGSLLGVEQSGHIAAVGFDLYCRMLAEAVEELKALQAGKTRKKEAELTPSIALPVTAYLPEEYVPRLNSRLSLYRRLAGIRYVEETADMAQELRDRFGALPQPVDNLLQL
ncbi:MAG: transcription-repair coupling factor, partial [Dehalococcoidia bacterium]|nr:transcription-repair coupling factor [Dehalococcoidia bacterium]